MDDKMAEVDENVAEVFTLMRKKRKLLRHRVTKISKN